MAENEWHFKKKTKNKKQKTKKIDFKEARNSFVGRAQTGFQFSRETEKLKQTNKQKWRRALVWI